MLFCSLPFYPSLLLLHCACAVCVRSPPLSSNALATASGGNAEGAISNQQYAEYCGTHTLNYNIHQTL